MPNIRLRVLVKKFCVLFLGLLPLASPAAQRSFPLDKNHTQITFTVSYFWLSKVNGYFGDFSGTFSYDEESISTAAVNLTINTESVDTRHQETNAHLRSEEFFNVKKFPTMTFSSTSVERTGERSARMNGNLTLLGVTKPITLEVTMAKFSGPDEVESGTRFTARGELKRSDFGMTYMMWAVGDKIELNIEAQTEVKNAAAN